MENVKLKIFPTSANFQKSVGFTLVEILVAVSLYSLIAAACFVAFITGNRSWQVNKVQLEIQQELRKAMDWMIEDLRQSGSSAIVDVPSDGVWYNSITFKMAEGINNGNISWSGDVQYALGGTNSNQLLRQTGGEEKILAQNITTLQFRRQTGTPKSLEVSLTAQKTTPEGQVLNQDLNFQIKLRN